MTRRIAFIGLGNMGAPMAANLVKAGHAVAGFDPAPGAIARAEAAGVRACASLAHAVDGAEAVITMLPNGALVLDTWRELSQLLPPGCVVVDSSTIDVASAVAAHALLPNAPTVDAPVSGGTAGAQAGTLSFMLGGEPAAIEAARPLLQPMAGRLIDCGGPGAGQAAKLCNNMLLGISMIGTAEAFLLGEQLGLSRQALFDVVSTSSGQCWSVTSYCPVPGPVPASPANRDYAPGFATALMLKDLRLAGEAAETGAVPTPLGAAARQIFEAFDAAGGGGRDFSAIIEFLRSQAGDPA